MEARKNPRSLRPYLTGTFAFRASLIVLWLLNFAALPLVGALRVRIAQRPLLRKRDEPDPHGPGPTTVRAAMRTVVIADTVTGLDNLLAVAAGE